MRTRVHEHVHCMCVHVRACIRNVPHPHSFEHAHSGVCIVYSCIKAWLSVVWFIVYSCIKAWLSAVWFIVYIAKVLVQAHIMSLLKYFKTINTEQGK